MTFCREQLGARREKHFLTSSRLSSLRVIQHFHLNSFPHTCRDCHIFFSLTLTPAAARVILILLCRSEARDREKGSLTFRLRFQRSFSFLLNVLRIQAELFRLTLNSALFSSSCKTLNCVFNVRKLVVWRLWVWLWWCKNWERKIYLSRRSPYDTIIML